MLAYRYKLYKSKNDKYLEAYNAIACEIWNHCIALHRRYYRLTGKHISGNRMKVHVTKLKKLPKYAHWKKLNSQAIQDIVERIDKSYKAFFDHVKQKKSGRKSPPHFCKRKNYRSFTLKQTGYVIDGNTVYIMGRRYKFVKSRDIEGNIKTVTVKKIPTGDWYLCITTDHEAKRSYARTGNAVGMDFGFKNFLVLSDGTKINSPEWLRQSLSELRRLSRSFSLKTEGSRNYEKAKRELTKLHEHIAAQRRDFFFKLANRLCREFDVIGIEDLNLKGMQALWGRKESDLAYGEFVSILEYVAESAGKRVVKINRWAPSTKTCSECGCRVDLSLKDRRWTCPHCGAVHDRDINAAINIRNLALAA